MKDIHIVRRLLDLGRFRTQRLEVFNFRDVILLVVLGRGTESALELAEMLAIQRDLLQSLPVVLVDEITSNLELDDRQHG